MTDQTQMRMDEAEENELLGETDGEREKDGRGIIEETAEDLMTDMKLEDDVDEVRSSEPDFSWLYHIEIYPWNADDMSEGFVRLIKLAQFSQIFMRKKSVGKQTAVDDVNTEKFDDKLPGRQRIGCLHLYTDNWQNARNIMRSSTWKTMAVKKLHFEITKRGPNEGQTESAYLELDTYNASKCRFRDKAKGELKDRSAKVSGLPATASREFLDVVFSRAYAAIGGTTVKEYMKDKEGKLQQKLQELNNFDGSIDFDCLGRGSCRAFVLAHMCALIQGQRLDIAANDQATMIEPTNTPDVAVKKKQENELARSSSATGSRSGRGRGNWGVRSRGVSATIRGGDASAGRGLLKSGTFNVGRGRALLPTQRPVTAPFTRPGAGMPVPMTGRQKMNEKLRRSNFTAAAGNSAGAYTLMAGLMGARGLGSVGDSFKQEIACLQNQLERSTQALEAKIALLQHTTQAGSGAYYQQNLTGYQARGSWDEPDFDYTSGYVDEARSYSSAQVGAYPAARFRTSVTAFGGSQGSARGLMQQGGRRGGQRSARRAGGRGLLSNYW